MKFPTPVTPGPIRHVVWDWNGTLWNDTDLCIDVMNGMLAERGLPQLDRPRYHAIFDFPVVHYYERLGFDLDAEAFSEVGAEFIRRYECRREEARLHPHAIGTLDWLRARGIQQSVLSAYRHDTLEELLTHAGIRGYFSGVLGSDNVYAEGKIEQGRRWIRELGLPPREVLLIGDTVHDHEVASAMSCRCLLVASGYHLRPKLERRGTPVIDNLSELPARINNDAAVRFQEPPA